MWEVDEGEECLVYVGVGSWVKEENFLSKDQQIPPFLLDDSKGNVVIYLIDANFRVNIPPIAVQLLKEEFETLQPTNGDKNVIIYNRISPQYKNKLKIYVLTEYFEEGKKWIPLMRACLSQHLTQNHHVFIGVYCHPYYCNEDNKPIIDFYHSFLNQNPNSTSPPQHPNKNLHFFLLADYFSSHSIPTNPTSSLNHSTRIWFLPPNTFHDQDLAVCKEVSRFYFPLSTSSSSTPSPSVNAGVAEYVYMNQKYKLGDKFMKQGEEEGAGDDVYRETERRIIEEIKALGGPSSVLEMNECLISELLTFVT